MDSPKVKYARTADGAHIAYQTWGSGPVDILISSGLWWHIEFQWTEPTVAHYLEALGRIGRVIAFDKRGTGLSDRVPVDRLPTLEERTDDLAAVLDAVGADKAVVIGQNHGAPMAILFVATYPERTHSLILSGAFARFVRAPDYPWGFPEDLAQRTLARMEEHWDEPNTLAQVAPSRVNDSHARDWWATMQRMAVSPAAAVALFRMSMDTDVRDVLAAIHVPTLVVHLTGDRLINIGCGRHLAEHIDGAQFVEAEGSDVVFEDLPEIGDAIEEFVTGRPARVSPTVSLRRWCSPTSLTRRSISQRWVTVAGARCSTVTTRWSKGRWSVIEVARSTRRATGCSRSSTVRHVRCSARAQYGMALGRSASRSALVYTPARSSYAATTSRGWQSTSERESRRSAAQATCS